eukprot:Gb_06614 [translate_table: standard]
MISEEVVGRTTLQSLLTAALFVQLAVAAIGDESTAGAGTVRIADVQMQWWNEKLPHIQIPRSLQARMSPLTQRQVQKFTRIIRDPNLQLNATEFCQSAGLMCQQRVQLLMGGVTSFACKHCETEARLHIFFPAKELKEGGEITLPDLHSPIPWKSFLPRNLAEMLPFSIPKFPEILRLFDIGEGSNMSLNMMNTLNVCEGRAQEGEVGKCSSSIENMIEFVLSSLGSDVELLFHPTTVGSGMKAKVRKVVGREYVRGKPAVACHNFVFPYGVYYCHSIKGTRAFAMELEVLHGKNKMGTYNGTALCHHFSNGTAQEIVNCHLIYGQTLLWLPKKP